MSNIINFNFIDSPLYPANFNIGEIRQKKFPLHEAVTLGEKAKVESLLKDEKIDINQRDEQGNTALHIAVKLKYAEIVKILLANEKIDVTKSDDEAEDEAYDDGDTPLQYAIKAGDREMVELLLQHEKIELIGNELNLAVISGDLEIIRTLLQHKKIDPNEYDAFLSAIKSQNLSIIKLFLDHEHIDVNGSNYSYSPLNVAIDTQNPAVVQLFLDHPKIDINAKVNDRRPSLLYAVEKTKFDNIYSVNAVSIVKLLLQHEKADVNGVSYGVHPLNVAIDAANPYVVQLFLAHQDININLAHKGQDSPLHHILKKFLADYNWNQELLLFIVKLFLQREDIDFNAVDDVGNTILHLMSLAFKNVNFFTDENQFRFFKHTVKRKNILGKNFLHFLAENRNKSNLLAPILDNLRKINKASFISKSSYIKGMLKEKSENTSNPEIHFLELRRLNREGILNPEHAKRNLQKRKAEESNQGIRLPNNIEFVALLNDQDDQGNTPLHYAVLEGNVDNVDALLNLKEVHPDLSNFEGKTPLAIANDKEYNEIDDLLVQRIAKDQDELLPQIEEDQDQMLTPKSKKRKLT